MRSMYVTQSNKKRAFAIREYMPVMTAFPGEH
jgi:hypothetical protein